MSVQSTLQMQSIRFLGGVWGHAPPPPGNFEKFGVNMHNFGKFHYECIHHLITYSTT